METGNSVPRRMSEAVKTRPRRADSRPTLELAEQHYFCSKQTRSLRKLWKKKCSSKARRSPLPAPTCAAQPPRPPRGSLFVTCTPRRPPAPRRAAPRTRLGQTRHGAPPTAPRSGARSAEKLASVPFSRRSAAPAPRAPPLPLPRGPTPRPTPHVGALRRQTRPPAPRADGLLPCGPQPPPCRCAPPAAAPRGDLLPRSLESVLRSGSAMPGRSAGGGPPARRELPHGGVPPRARLPPRRRRAHTWHSCAGREAAPQCACPRRPIAAPRRGPVPRRPGRWDRLGSSSRRALAAAPGARRHAGEAPSSTA